jgi:hypothetical protein
VQTPEDDPTSKRFAPSHDRYVPVNHNEKAVFDAITAL